MILKVLALLGATVAARRGVSDMAIDDTVGHNNNNNKQQQQQQQQQAETGEKCVNSH
jgi:hypothetical protein